jgi:hypothetical protein
LGEVHVLKQPQEKGSAPDLDWPFHDSQLRELERLLEKAFLDSTLPEARDRRAVSEFLVCWRCGEA